MLGSNKPPETAVYASHWPIGAQWVAAFIEEDGWPSRLLHNLQSFPGSFAAIELVGLRETLEITPK